jgi:hypothetical protein
LERYHTTLALGPHSGAYPLGSNGERGDAKPLVLRIRESLPVPYTYAHDDTDLTQAQICLSSSYGVWRDCLSVTVSSEGRSGHLKDEMDDFGAMVE